jgi:hypothetical protein
MSNFVFRASIETETAKQDKTHSELLEVLADHILAMTDKRHGTCPSRVPSSFRSPNLL